jgi:glutathione S-transferase
MVVCACNMPANIAEDARMRYELYYWPGIQGRGEFVRLALEEGDAPYRDMARLAGAHGAGVAAMLRLLDEQRVAHPAFAPPFLKAGKLLIGQTANILCYLGGRLGLAPATDEGRLWTHQLQLTIADLVLEVHDTHHPISGALYYEQQKPAAKRRTQNFLDSRLPKFLRYFETVIVRNKRRTPWMIGSRLTYVDLSMAQVIAGLRFAFPNASARKLRSCPRLRALHDAVFERPRIQRYAASGRRIAFNNDGIFRQYPELDLSDGK